MEEFFLQYGVGGLFLVSFLASTILPLGSEWLLVALLLKGVSPMSVVAAATIGNVLGAFTTYFLGMWGSAAIIGRVVRIDEKQRARAERFFHRYGSATLLLSWLPVIGDSLCLVSGLLRVPFTRFALLVGLGKLGRYVAVAWIVAHGAFLPVAGA